MVWNTSLSMIQRLRPNWWMNRRNRTQLQIAGVKIRARLHDRFFLRVLPFLLVPLNAEPLLELRTYRFDHPNRAVGHRPVDLRGMPQLQLRMIVHSLDAYFGAHTLRFGQQFRLIFFQIDDSVQAQSYRPLRSPPSSESEYPEESERPG
jgi:hypothetical protein